MITNLSADQIDEFTLEVQTRGEEYFKSGKVTFTGFFGGDATFEVRGGAKYEVEISYSEERRRFYFGCTCPQGELGQYCKHIWASVLEVDRLQILKDVLEGVRDDSSENGTSPASSSGSSGGGSFAPLRVVPWDEIVKRAQDRVRTQHEIKGAKQGAKSSASLNRRIGSYAIDLEKTAERGQVFLHLFIQERLKKGGLSNLKSAELAHSKIELYEDTTERDFLWDLLGRTQTLSYSASTLTASSKVDGLFIAPGQADAILRKISASRKLTLRKRQSSRSYILERIEVVPYEYAEEILNLHLNLRREGGDFLLEGQLTCSTETHSCDEVLKFIDHFVFLPSKVVRSDLAKFQIWYETLKSGPLRIGESELRSFLDFYFSQSQVPPITLPDELSFAEVHDLHPRVQLKFSLLKDSGKFAANLHYVYHDQTVRFGSGDFVYILREKQMIRRHLDIEAKAHSLLRSLDPASSEDPEIEGVFGADEFVVAAENALGWGWEVLVQEQKVRLGGGFQIDVVSGVDWFDLQANFQFGDVTLRMPQLIHAIRTGQRTLALGDGKVGLLPEEWFQKIAPIIGMAQITETGLRLNKVQALFLSASLDDKMTVHGDRSFKSLAHLVQELRNLDAVDPDKSFIGELRTYQRQGLAWLKLLADQQLGGVLADDMGLGKTIQILALLSGFYSGHRTNSKSATQSSLPSLVVAPKSLVFNWRNEAGKFTPDLEVVTFSAGDRDSQLQNLKGGQIVLTTYHTLRNHIEAFQNIQFEFLILDEAHNIKNPRSQISMACRLLKARKKFALTGTPVENSLLDLFSILSIVTPGLVSETQAMRWVKDSSPESMGKLARALSPFLLRRNKEDVLKDLPEKLEQVLYCELSPEESRRYNDLKSYYWGLLSDKIAEQGLAKSKIEVLEALLRLRQAACHQGLLDSNLENAGSAKFEMLIEQLELVIADGHKALVFSQFTSLLGLFCRELERRNISYEYLDGQTTNREERVENFQTNKNCSVFVLSLKAGGVGLNLTAADYVFILDPWWNPAAESQAIDRSHRIGQERKVFAYKIIAKDTIEEKILALQAKKKEIAKAIISADAGLLKNLQVEDLKQLFN